MKFAHTSTVRGKNIEDITDITQQRTEGSADMKVQSKFGQMKHISGTQYSFRLTQK